MYGDSVYPGLVRAETALQATWDSITSRAPDVFARLFPKGFASQITPQNQLFFGSLLKSVAKKLEITFDTLFEMLTGVHI